MKDFNIKHNRFSTIIKSAKQEVRDECTAHIFTILTSERVRKFQKEMHTNTKKIKTKLRTRVV